MSSFQLKEDLPTMYLVILTAHPFSVSGGVFNLLPEVTSRKYFRHPLNISSKDSSTATTMYVGDEVLFTPASGNSITFELC